MRFGHRLRQENPPPPPPMATLYEERGELLLRLVRDHLQFQNKARTVLWVGLSTLHFKSPGQQFIKEKEIS